MGIPDFQKLDKWEDTEKMSQQILRISKMRENKKKDSNTVKKITMT